MCIILLHTHVSTFDMCAHAHVKACAHTYKTKLVKVLQYESTMEHEVTRGERGPRATK